MEAVVSLCTIELFLNTFTLEVLCSKDFANKLA